jgi:hypothetical protein
MVGEGAIDLRAPSYKYVVKAERSTEQSGGKIMSRSRRSSWTRRHVLTWIPLGAIKFPTSGHFSLSPQKMLPSFVIHSRHAVYTGDE